MAWKKQEVEPPELPPMPFCQQFVVHYRREGLHCTAAFDTMAQATSFVQSQEEQGRYPTLIQRGSDILWWRGKMEG